MAMTRMQRRAAAAHQRYLAAKDKPPTRKQAQAWLAPIRRAFAEIRTGYADAVQGYVVTRLHTGDDYARVDYCINGFVAMMERLSAEFDVAPLKSVSRKLSAGVMLTEQEVDTCLRSLDDSERRLLNFTRRQLIDAATTEQIMIEMEKAGLREAA